MVENVIVPGDVEQQDEMLTTAIPDVPTDPQPVEEPQVEVAGLGSVLREGAEAVGRKIKGVGDAIDDARPIGRDVIEEPVEMRGDLFVVRDPTDDEITKFNSIVDIMTTGVPSPTTGQRAAGIPLARINFENVNTLDDEKALMDRLLQTYEGYIKQQKRGSMSFDEIMSRASEMNQDGVLDLLLKRKIGTTMNAEELLAGRLVLWNINAETTRLHELIISGTATEAERKNFLTALSLEAKVSANLLGARSEAARATAASRIAVDVSPGRTDALNKMIAGASDESVEWLAQAYAVLPSQEAKQRFSRGIIGKSIDVWQEVWINSMLSGFTTHAVNVASNLAFIGIQIPERALAGVFGAARRKMTGSTEGIRSREALSMAHGMTAGFMDALMLSAKAFKQDSPVSAGMKSKLEVRERRAISSQKFGLDSASTFGRGIDLLGTAVRLPGRFLIAEDEFFKAMSGRMQLHAVAYRRMMSSIDAGMPKAQAQQQYELSLRNPTDDIMDEVNEFSDVVTFQQDLDGVLANFQKTFNHPIGKIFVPFFRTPTNVVKAVSERSPLALAMPSFYRAIKAGGAQADAALAKIAMGSSFMATFGMFAGGTDGDEIIITGAGPSKYASSAAMQRQGFQPYSFNFRQEDGTYKSVSYSRFDPISGLMAIAADYAEYAKYEDNPDVLEELAGAAVMAATNYLGQLPMVQGAASVSELIGNEYASTTDRAMAAVELFAKQASSSLLGPAFGGSMMASIERYNDPTMNDTKVSTEENPLIKGFYEALNEAKSRNPFFSKDLPPKLNMWGEVRKAGYGEAWEMVSPIRIKDAQFNVVDKEIQYLNFAIGGSLKPPARSIDGVGLNAEQYNELITYMNNELIGGMTLLETLQDEILDPGYISKGVDDRVEDLRAIISDFKSRAEKIVISNNPELGVEIDINNLPYEERMRANEGTGITSKIMKMVD